MSRAPPNMDPVSLCVDTLISREGTEPTLQYGLPGPAISMRWCSCPDLPYQASSDPFPW